MARDISKRLSQLSTRRRGLDRLSTLSADSMAEILAKRDITEDYQKRSTLPYTQYALGAMQEVGPSYTQVGLDEATRVGKQLSSRLEAKSIGVSFQLQGSVPLNIHIRGVSDVDLLTLHSAFITYDREGRLSQGGGYTNPISYTPESKMRELRLSCEQVLPDAFPKADVDTSGSKAIKISGGSLRRAIDVVPAHWHDTIDYQNSRQQHDRGVCVYNKTDHSTFLNMPFKHIKFITDRDEAVLRGLKKTIRLCKNIKSDAEAEGKSIKISSYEIASLMWHCKASDLIVASHYELGLLAVTQSHLDNLARNYNLASTLWTPDNTRRILDTAEKLNGLAALSAEVDDLAAEVAKEQQATLRHLIPSYQQVRDTLHKSFVPIV